MAEMEAEEVAVPPLVGEPGHSCAETRVEVTAVPAGLARARLMRFAELTVGLTANYLMVIGFDYVLYPLVIFYLGVWYGGLVMMGLSLAICLLTVWFYDWAGRDWLGIEAIKSMRDYTGTSRLGRLSVWMLRKSEPVIFLYLSLMSDPFITMVAMRRGAYNGMSARDWRIFLGSFALGNITWIFACWTGISLAEWVWRAIAG
jgi:hypothetical protein